MQRETGQMGLLEAFIQDGIGHNEVLKRISQSIDWQSIEVLLCGYGSSERGRPAWPALTLFRSLLLAQWYNLSDPGLEEALGDRLSFRRFVGLGLNEGTPDHSVFCRFRQFLVQHGLGQKVFDEVLGQLEKQGLIVKQGTLIDATLVEAQARRPASGKGEHSEVDPDARFWRKGAKKGFGYKAHVAVDKDSHLIRKAILTPGNVNDTEVADALIGWDEKAVYADQAYDTHRRRKALKRAGIIDRIMHRPNKHHPELPRLKQARNNLIKEIRRRVERVFGTMKRTYHYTRVRYYSLATNELQLHLMCLAMNLRRALVLRA